MITRAQVQGAASPTAGTQPPQGRLVHGGRVLVAQAVNSPRWTPGERLEHLWDECCRRHADRLAVDGPAARLTYAELDADANRLARLLVRRGLVAGARVGLLFADPARTYAAMLAVLKLRGVYVPLDAAFPPERIAYIATDAGLAAVLTDSDIAGGLTAVDSAVSRLLLDELAPAIAGEPGEPFAVEAEGSEAGAHCYIIYTSGTTGRPKGVAVTHPSICNFIRVAADVYGVRAEDRVYQGLTIAFDFAVEEIWVAWMTGATLVPRPPPRGLVGEELRDFVREHRVSALCCVPTLLATLEEDLPGLRFVLVSGEPCPPGLVSRWHRPERRLLNVYGPTEATVSATWTVLSPDRPVTIGVPLPTYSIAILSPEAERVLAPGEVGEIAIAGIGLAEGYLNQPERTARSFIPDVLGLEENPSGRLYRTGDLGRITAEAEVEHLGRIDTQVKIRGYRVEIEEIESALRELPEVAQAAVNTHTSAAGVVELAAFVVAAGSAVDPERLTAHLRGRLPEYMLPAYLEELVELPLMPSGKLDRRRLPAPQRRSTVTEGHADPADPVEATLARTLATTLGLERVSVESDLFASLGLSSLLLARWIAELRRTGDLPAVSVRDVYRTRSVRALASAISTAQEPEVPRFEDPQLPAARGAPRYVLCGALQVLVFLLYAAGTAAAVDAFSGWITAAYALPALLARASLCGAATLLATALLPVAVKWLLVGRFRPQRIRVWSLAYLRFWVVKTLIVANPLVRLLAGTSLYVLYLRALGARIGRGTLILTTHIPVAADLLQIGDETVIRKDAYLNGYRARDGVIEIGPVSIGSRAFVGEQAVIDIGTSIGDGAQLGHSSGLSAGQSIPAGACWHGSPARPAEPGCSYQTVPQLPEGAARRGLDGALRLLSMLVLVGPIAALAATFLLSHSQAPTLLPVAAIPLVAASLVLGAVLLGGLLSGVVPRLLSRTLEPGRVYPLPGRHYSAQRAIARMSNLPMMVSLFGDSSAIVGYLRWLGYRLGRVQQTGSNFGTTIKHEMPSLCHVGRGTMVSDGLSMMNLECSSTAFRVVPVRIGERNYVGNAVGWPPDARMGENCLIATKALLPITGELRRGVGLLGSPAFEIPRTPEPHPELAALSREPEGRRRLAAKNRHNAATVALYLLVRIVFVCALLVSARSVDGLHGWADLAATTLQTGFDVLIIPLLLFVPVERATTRFRPLQPLVCSILQRDFWAHERFWKVPSVAYLRLFDGTPLKNLVWHALGVRGGGRVFDDGATIIERSLVGLGRGATLNMGCIVQGHSLEDGIFKSDRITIGPGSTVGTGAVVHYGVEMGAGSVLEADSFLMKGSRPAAGDRWRGNPAAEIRTTNGKASR